MLIICGGDFDNMLTIFYIITMAIAFTSNFMGANTNYYIRLCMGLLWIVLWAVRSKGVIKTNRFLRYLLFPWLFIFVLTVFLWICNRPEYFNSSYITRMLSNVLYCLVATINAYIGIDIFGKKIINMSFYALLCSIGANFISVWQKFGTAHIISYLTTVLIQNYNYESIMQEVAMDMEVQGATMAIGIFFVYYLLFYHNEERKFSKLKYLLLSMIGLYVGFKRVVVLGLVVVLGILWIMKFKRIKVHNCIFYTFIVFSAISFGYIALVKTDYISLISAYFNVDMMGRTNIYRNASNLFELSPFYLGLGFGYAAKYMFDTTRFAVHSDILRMYMELGFLPFIGWLWYYIYFIPKKAITEFGIECGKVCLTITVFVFSTFLVENTLGLYPLHYGLTLFTLLQLANDERDREFVKE